MADDVLDSWEDATDIGEFEKRMDQREKDILKQEESEKKETNVSKYSTLWPQEESGRSEYIPQIKILKRQNGPAQQKTKQTTAKPTKTLAEKEADYAAARARILGNYSNTNQDEESKKIILASESPTSNGKTSSQSTSSPNERSKR